jgi:hypothetical protein
MMDWARTVAESLGRIQALWEPSIRKRGLRYAVRSGLRRARRNPAPPKSKAYES